VDAEFEPMDFIPEAPPMNLTRPQPASAYSIARVPPGTSLDWHAAPVRELAIYLAGEGEIEASDGTIRAIVPGTILLVEDTHGKGHQTRVTGTDEVLVVIVMLPAVPASD
jgi:quercetin dioxygenase-like cupin family protein